MYLKVLVRLGWLLVLGYPVVFFAVVLLAEKVLAPKNYPAGVVVAIPADRIQPIGWVLDISEMTRVAQQPSYRRQCKVLHFNIHH